MLEWIKTALISIGGGATASISLLLIGKLTAGKVFDNLLTRSTIRLSNKLERSTKAYDFLLRKEYEYYDNINPFLATIVPLVQDLKYYSTDLVNTDPVSAKEHYKEGLLQYMEMILKIKNDHIMFQPYISKELFDAVSFLIQYMQGDLNYLSDVASWLCEEKAGMVNIQKMTEIQDKILGCVSQIVFIIKTKVHENAGI